jgi:hypothetical protein
MVLLMQARGKETVFFKILSKPPSKKFCDTCELSYEAKWEEGDGL